MKRLSTSYKLILHCPALLVGEKRATLLGKTAPERFKVELDLLHGFTGVRVMDCDFVELTTQESPFHRTGLGIRQVPLGGRNFQNPQRRLIGPQRDVDVHRLGSRPSDQLFGRVSPTQAEGQTQQRLAMHLSADTAEDHSPDRQPANDFTHAGTMNSPKTIRKQRSHVIARGFMLVEAMVSLSLLTALGLTMLKLSLDILAPRQWVIQQTITDAYMTRERALMERVPFAEIQAAPAGDLAAPIWPTTAIDVTLPAIGSLPQGRPISGTVKRGCVADANNNNLVINPTRLEAYTLTSTLTYTIGTRTYTKSRSVYRTQ